MAVDFCLGCPVPEVLEGIWEKNTKYSTDKLLKDQGAVQRLARAIDHLVASGMCPGMPEFQTIGDTTNIICAHENVADMDWVAAEISGSDTITVTAVNVRHERNL